MARSKTAPEKPEPEKSEPAAEWVPIGDLVPWEQNPRRNDVAVAKVAESIQRFGFGAPIVARREDRQIIAGHTRLKAALRLGLERVPVRYVDLDPEEARLLALADNRLSELAEWDDALLAEVLSGLSADRVEIAGWDATELERIVAGAAGAIEEDEAPEPPRIPVTRPGDLWVLGDHRLLCGDSTVPSDVARASGGARAALIATDPPYGVAYGVESGAESAAAHRPIANDENDGPRLQAFLERAFGAAIAVLRPNAAWYLWHAQLTQGFFAAAAAAAAAQVLIHRQIVWVKPSLILGHGDYHWRHELCFYGWRAGHRAPWYGNRSQTTIWEVGRERSGVHPTQKPVELFARPMRHNTARGEWCYEPFAGSGTCIAAAEQTERRCFGLELDPAYCDVIVERWERLAGAKARREAA